LTNGLQLPVEFPLRQSFNVFSVQVNLAGLAADKIPQESRVEGDRASDAEEHSPVINLQTGIVPSHPHLPDCRTTLMDGEQCAALGHKTRLSNSCLRFQAG